MVHSSADLAPWSDPEFSINFRRRLRLPVFAPGLSCQHRARSGNCCAEPLDRYGDHACACLTGGAHTVLHNQMSDALAEFAAQAGLHCVREIVVPELATARIRQPRADIQMWGHPSLPLLHGDATVISTHRRAANVARATPG